MRPSLVTLLGLILTLSGCLAADGEDASDTALRPAPSDDTDDTVPPDAGPTVVPLEVAATGFYPILPSFTPATLEVTENSTVELTYRNDDLNPLGKHDWVIDGYEPSRTQNIAVGEETTVTFTAPPPGTYTYICSVPTHQDRGMEGTFTVTAA